jgi:hypothetical protein
MTNFHELAGTCRPICASTELCDFLKTNYGCNCIQEFNLCFTYNSKLSHLLNSFLQLKYTNYLVQLMFFCLFEEFNFCERYKFMTLIKTLLVCYPITKIPSSSEIVTVMFHAGAASVEPDLKN